MINKLYSPLLTTFIFLGLMACSSGGDQKFHAKPGPSVTTEEVSYTVNGKTMKGILALPAGEGPFPGVVVVHEWWGRNDYPQSRAIKFAENGYAAFALDLYGDAKTAEHPTDAKSFSSKVMADLNGVEKSFRAAVQAFQAHPKVDKTRLAAAGYCFGGAVVLEMARRNLPGLQMVASYHGDLTPLVKNQPRPIQARMLIFNGAADPFVSAEAVETARKNLKTAKARYKFVNYKGAKHGFTNPEADSKGEKFDLPLAYDKKADDDSWQQTLAAMKIVFKM
jgi:dienelactone hydrolase